MIVENSEPRSRRAILAAAAGAAAATVASAIGRPELVSAADGQAVAVGGEYTSTSVTKIEVLAPGMEALWGHSESYTGVLGSSTSGWGVQGDSSTGMGVSGSSTSGWAVYGNSTSGVGVRGFSKAGFAMYGESASTSWPAVEGLSTGDRTGVMGQSGTATFPSAPTKTGVYGYAAQDAAAVGVRGQSTAGRGLLGEATTGQGLRALATTGTGAYVTTSTGTAILAKTSGPKSGTALQAIGRVRFDNSVGIATVAAGTSSVTVTPGIDLTTTSAVVATLQGNPSGTLTVKGVVVNATADTFTIYLTANATAAVKVAWHVFG